MVKKCTIAAVFCASFLMFSALGSVTASAQSLILKKGMQGDSITMLQKDLKGLGYFSVNPTGYYGDITKSAVISFQERNGLQVDGIAGPRTLETIANLMSGAASSMNGNAAIQASRGSDARGEVSYALPWFEEVSELFTRGQEAVVYDIDSGLSFRVKRTYGTNHADVETVSAQDTAILRKIYGGSFSWQRRAIIVDVNGRKIAASMAGMPHAGIDAAAAEKVVSGRSGGFGTGVNLDAVKGNAMDGHFDMHFLGSRTHGTNRVDPQHQSMVQKAAKWAQEHYR